MLKKRKSQVFNIHVNVPNAAKTKKQETFSFGGFVCLAAIIYLEALHRFTQHKTTTQKSLVVCNVCFFLSLWQITATPHFGSASETNRQILTTEWQQKTKQNWSLARYANTLKANKQKKCSSCRTMRRGR